MENIKSMIKHNMRQYAMLMALVAIMILFQITTGGILLKPINVSRLIMQNSYILILAIGMVLCILTGGGNIDLSVGSIVALVSASSAVFSVIWGGLPVVISIILGLVVGTLAGMWQGYWIAYVKIPAFIVTLAGMLVFRGINNLILNGETISLPDLYVTIASSSLPDFIGGEGGLHVTTVVVGFITSIIFVLFRIKDRKDKIEYKFEVASPMGFTVQMAILVIIINLFMFWLALAKGLPYIVIILAVLIVIYSFITQKKLLLEDIYMPLVVMLKQQNYLVSKRKESYSGYTPIWVLCQL